MGQTRCPVEGPEDLPPHEHCAWTQGPSGPVLAMQLLAAPRLLCHRSSLGPSCPVVLVDTCGPSPTPCLCSWPARQSGAREASSCGDMFDGWSPRARPQGPVPCRCLHYWVSSKYPSWHFPTPMQHRDLAQAPRRRLVVGRPRDDLALGVGPFVRPVWELGRQDMRRSCECFGVSCQPLSPGVCRVAFSE